MVRINLVEPRKLSDQHLIAEYNEILMLLGHFRKHPSTGGIPEGYCLGEGHIKFFRDKLLYIKRRHELLSKEMKKRGFAATVKADIDGLGEGMKKDWEPEEKDFEAIKKRLVEKVKKKPKYYTYYRRKRQPEFFISMLRDKRARE